MEILVHFFGTIFAGALTLFSIAAGFWICACTSKSLWQWFEEKRCVPTSEKEGIAAHGIAVLALLSFGIGIFAEGMTDYMTDSESAPGWFGSLKEHLGSEGKHRFRTLFKEPKTKGARWQLSGIGKEMFETPHGREYVTNVLGADHEFALHPEDVVNHVAFPPSDRARPSNYSHPIPGGKDFVTTNVYSWEKVYRLVNRLYYPAKNWATGHEKHSGELEKLQMRIDWSRTTFLVAWLVPLFSLALGVIVWVTREKILELQSPPPNASSIPAAKVSGLMTAWRLLVAACVVFAATEISREAYAQAEDQYNERAFGYYLSHAQRELWNANKEKSPTAFRNTERNGLVIVRPRP